METMRLYFTVLAKEASIVHSKFGMEKAFISKAFLTDLIPGVSPLIPSQPAFS